MRLALILALCSIAGAQECGDRLAKPTPRQLAWADLGFGMFIHFAPNTYNNTQYDLGGASNPKRFNPVKLDVDQWVTVAASMGAKYIVLVAKHVGGFCLWPTVTTKYSIKSSPWHDGEGDIVGSLAAACRRRGMQFGVYVSPRDDHRGVDTGGLVRSGLAEDQARYDEIYRKQLTELLTGYGKLVEIWFDGSANGDLAGPIIRKHQPDAMVFQSGAATIRWVGNENGVARYPLWNMVSRQAQRSGEALGAGDPDGDAWLPAECDVPIRRDWFWTTTNESSLKTVDQLMDIYYKSVGRGGTLLLNQTPDRTGLIPEADVKRGAEFGAEIRRRFGKSVAETHGDGSRLELPLAAPALVDHAVVMEDIAQGQRIREYRIEAQVGGEWTIIAQGSSIGHKKIDRFEPVRATRLRMVVTKSVCEPKIRSFAVYNASR